MRLMSQLNNMTGIEDVLTLDRYMLLMAPEGNKVIEKIGNGIVGVAASEALIIQRQ